MPEWILPMLTIIFGGGGLITAIVGWRKDRRQGPVDVQSAQVANAAALSNAASGLIATLTDRQNDFEERLSAKEQLWEQKLAAQDEKIEHLQSHIDTWMLWYNDLKANWFVHREKSSPPHPPQV